MENTLVMSGLELVKWFPVLVLIFIAWCSRGKTKQGTGEENLEEAKYRIEILNFNSNLTSSNIYIQFPPPHKKALICSFLQSGKGYGYTVCIR